MLLLAASQGAAAVAAGGAGGPAGGVRQDVQLDALDDAVRRQRLLQPPVVVRSGADQSELSTRTCISWKLICIPY